MQKETLDKEHPELLEYWDYEKNTDILPSEVTSGMVKKVWWKCNNGKTHSYYCAIAQKVRGSGCPYCSRRKVLEGFNDLATTNPEVSKFWDYEKNTDILPTEITKGSRKKVWWKCEKGHSWQNIVYAMTNNTHKCPYCNNTKVQKGYNDLLTLQPFLCKEWDYDKNDINPTEIIEGSNYRAWWRCKRGHSWQTKVSHRTQGARSGCPYCRDVGTSYPEQYLYLCIKNKYKDTKNRVKIEGEEADIYIPELCLIIEYDGCMFHSSKYKINKDSAKDTKWKEHGYNVLRIKEVKNLKQVTITLECIQCPVYTNRLDMMRVVLKALNKWIFDVYEVCTNIIEIDNVHIKVLERLHKVAEKRSIAEVYPELSLELHPTLNGEIDATMLSVGSEYKVWWQCSKCGEGYLARVNLKTRKGVNGEFVRSSLCYNCSQAEKIRGKELTNMHSEVLIDWAFDLNKKEPNSVSCHSNYRAYWRCHICGKEWTNKVCKEVSRKTRGCKDCAKKKT